LTDFFLYYSSRRHVPIKLRKFAEFLRKESKRTAQAEQNIAIIAPSQPRSRRSKCFNGSDAIAVGQV
jgi:hypothetical protein